jgi:hypothetical protein
LSRKNQHQDNRGNLKALHNPVENSTEGGVCIVRCKAPRAAGANGRLLRNSCNYRWQGFEQALRHESERYNYPAYKALCGVGPFSMEIRNGGPRTVAPTEKTWDITDDGDNFQASCNVPYWHEAHHLIPNAELRLAISNIAKGPLKAEYFRLYRRGLMEEKYNLNHKKNMMILPLDNQVSEALGLPRHREHAGVLHHKAYSTEVRTRLQSVFPLVTAAEKKHEEKPPYKRVAEQLEAVSARMRQWVIDAGGGRSLDDAAKDEL